MVPDHCDFYYIPYPVLAIVSYMFCNEGYKPSVVNNGSDCEHRPPNVAGVNAFVQVPCMHHI